MVYRVLLLLSVVPIALGLAARWWCGRRVLAGEGGRVCRIDASSIAPWLGEWPRGSATAADLGGHLRAAALEAWRSEEAGAAKARERSLRFGLAVPPLSALVAVFALLVGKVPVLGALAIPLAATACGVAFGLLSLSAELAAITRAARRLREERVLRNADDEEAVIRCAAAHAWVLTLPPVLR